MSNFDPVKTRQILEKKSLAFAGSYDLEDTGSFLKGAVSTSRIATIVDSILVGLSNETQDIAERTQRWLQEAIAEGECTTDRDASSADWHQQSLSYALALTKFLRGQGLDRESFAPSASLIERSWRTRVPPFEHKMIADGQLE